MKRSNEKENYKKKIIEMVEKIENLDYLIKIFSFIKVFLEEWKRGQLFMPSFLYDFQSFCLSILLELLYLLYQAPYKL